MSEPAHFQASYRALSARTDGAAACRRGADRGENPFVADTDFYLRSAWSIGFDRANLDRLIRPQNTMAA